MQKILKGEYNFRIQNFSNANEFLEIEQSFNAVLDYNKKLKDEKYDLLLEKEKQEKINLQLQINPHLLLNSLNTIYSLAQNSKNKEIQVFSINLAKYFRYSLRNKSGYVKIQDEISFIDSFIEVQKIRYPDQFYLMYDIDEKDLDYLIPPLIIQNFIENSTKYALIPGEQIEILCLIQTMDKKLRIIISDNGKGMPKEIVDTILAHQIISDSRGKHLGIWNCIQRLNAYYNKNYYFSITSQPGNGTQIWIELPLKIYDKDSEL